MRIVPGLVSIFAFLVLLTAACGDDDGGDDTGISGAPCDDVMECVPGNVCYNKFCVGQGELRVSLTFTTDSDFDLHLITPAENEIYFGNEEADGGVLDVDQCITSCGADSHVENIFFPELPASGVYKIFVENFDGRAAGDFTVDVVGLVNQTYTGALEAVEDAKSMEFMFTI